MEPLGSDIVAHCSLQSMERNLITRLPGDCAVTEGETLQLGFLTRNLHLFDSRAAGGFEHEWTGGPPGA